VLPTYSIASIQISIHIQYPNLVSLFSKYLDVTASPLKRISSRDSRTEEVG
jgi:hypothetical protein